MSSPVRRTVLGDRASRVRNNAETATPLFSSTVHHSSPFLYIVVGVNANERRMGDNEKPIQFMGHDFEPGDFCIRAVQREGAAVVICTLLFWLLWWVVVFGPFF